MVAGSSPAGPTSLCIFTAFILMEPQGQGTKYTAIAVHPDEASAQRHAEMGFQDGWGTALDQLVAYMKTI